MRKIYLNASLLLNDSRPRVNNVVAELMPSLIHFYGQLNSFTENLASVIREELWQEFTINEKKHSKIALVVTCDGKDITDSFDVVPDPSETLGEEIKEAAHTIAYTLETRLILYIVRSFNNESPVKQNGAC